MAEFLPAALTRHGVLLDRLVTAALIAAVTGVDVLLAGADLGTVWGWDLPGWALILLTASAHQGLWWRRSRPWLVLAIEVGFALITLVVPMAQPVAGLLVALFAAARRAASEIGVVPLVVTMLPLAVHAYATELWLAQRDEFAALNVLTLLTLWFGVAALVWGVGRRAHRSAVRAAEFHAWQRTQAEAALREERLRIARELHDSVAGSVTGMLLTASLARRTVGADADETRASLRRIELAAGHATDELQRLLRLLTDAEGSHDGPGLADLPRLLRAHDDAGAPSRLTVTGQPGPLAPAVDLAGFRLVQEALTNAAKHAPGTLARIEVDWLPGQVRISVGNEKPRRSRQAPGGGLGLAGLTERVRAVGGTLTRTDDPETFAVTAVLPRPMGPS